MKAMRYLSQLGLAAGCSAALGGCTTLEHGWVVERLSDDQAIVRLGSADGIEPGSRVTFYDMRCEEHITVFGEHESCHHVQSGEGSVVQVLGEHDAIVRADRGVGFRWSQVVGPNKVQTTAH